MTDAHTHLELFFLVVGGVACTAMLVAKLVLIGYQDLRQTWKKVKRK